MGKWMSKGIIKAASLLNMKNRMNYFKVAPEALEHVMQLDKYTKKTSIDRQLRELIKIRVSQMNGCSYCLNMHTKDAQKLKVPDPKIKQLSTWRDSDIYNEQEKMALELAENITLIAEKGVHDELYGRVREVYDEKEYVDLVMIINVINMWNRISIAMGNKSN